MERIAGRAGLTGLKHPLGRITMARMNVASINQFVVPSGQRFAGAGEV